VRHRVTALKSGKRVPETVAEGLSACDILFMLPISTASAERSFSILQRLKTWLRSRMGEEWLTGLALLNIHLDFAVSLDNVTDRFAKAKSKK